jgi:hypothetical protein
MSADIKNIDFIEVYENVFNDEFCDSLISKFDELEEAGLSHRRDYTTLNVKNDSALYVGYNLEHLYKHAEKFYKHFWSDDCFGKYEKECIPVDGRDLSIFNLKVQKTKPSEGYHVWHCENSSRDTSHRVAAFTVYLNDDFEAGETEFLYQQRRLKPKKGSVSIFPAAYTHLHRGNPPIGGTKYIITGWLEY